MTRAEPHPLDALPVHPGGPRTVVRRLVVDGLGARRLELTPADLAALPLAEASDDFRCLEGWSVPGLYWRDVAVATLLDMAGVDAMARSVQASAGEFSVLLTIDEARRALLATQLDDRPLAPEHGSPVRLVLPGVDCYTSIIWLDLIELRANPGPNTGREIALGRLAR
ncbi:MAG: molybdopterin-dependent oxidoreductase [Burkholderiales bacterium]|nr:molybdopterin-dependent oxidoreductase [Burkholderiales bacterium]